MIIFMHISVTNPYFKYLYFPSILEIGGAVAPSVPIEMPKAAPPITPAADTIVDSLSHFVSLDRKHLNNHPFLTVHFSTPFILS